MRDAKTPVTAREYETRLLDQNRYSGLGKCTQMCISVTWKASFPVNHGE